MLSGVSLYACLANTAAYFSWCLVVHYFSNACLVTILPSIKKASKAVQEVASNRIAAALHAVVMFGLTAHYWLSINPSMEWTPHVTDYQGLCIDVMTGYMIYDTWNEICTNWEQDVLLHHIMGLIVHILARALDSGMTAYFCNLVYIAEASTPLLHLSWLLYNVKLTDTLFFKGLAISVVLVFFACRVLLAPYMDWLLYQSYYETTPVGVLWANETVLFYMNVFIMLAFTALNNFWFYKLVRTAVKAATSPGAKVGDHNS